MQKPVNVGNWRTPVPRESISPIIDETAEWETYRNEEYGFEFKYPAEYIILEDSNNWDILVFTSEEDKNRYEICESIDTYCHEGFNIILESLQKNPEDTLENLSNDLTKDLLEGGSTSIMTINNTRTLKYFFRGFDTRYDIFFDRSNAILHIRVNFSAADMENTFNQILSTFKFLE